MKVKIYYFKFRLLTILFGTTVASISAQQFDKSETNISAMLGTSSYSGNILPIKKYTSQYGNCYAYAPTNWVITGSPRDGTSFEMYSTDRNMFAGYLILGIQGSLATGFYSQIYATPETFLNHVISESGQRLVSYGKTTVDNYGYAILPFEIEGAPPVKGVVFYRVWPVPGDPYGYIIAMRIAKTVKQHWKGLGTQAISVALSIRSTVQIQSTGSNNFSGSSDDKIVESGYNIQLGMEYAHDPDTGENYWVSPSKDYNETGVDGPGYYKYNGNDTKKLILGRSDD